MKRTSGHSFEHISEIKSVRSKTIVHFEILELNKNKIEAKFTDTGGESVKEYFNINQDGDDRYNLIVLMLQVVELRDSYKCWSKDGKAKKSANTMKWALSCQAKKNGQKLQTKEPHGTKLIGKKSSTRCFKSSERKFLELGFKKNRSKLWKTYCWIYLKSKISGTASTGFLWLREKFCTWALGEKNSQGKRWTRYLSKYFHLEQWFNTSGAEERTSRTRKRFSQKLKNWMWIFCYAEKWQVEMQNTKKVQGGETKRKKKDESSGTYHAVKKDESSGT
jgi:hypothetical protein